MSLKNKSGFKSFVTSITVIWPFSTVCLDMRPPWPSFAQIVISIVQVTPSCVHHEVHLDLDLMYKVEWMVVDQSLDGIAIRTPGTADEYQTKIVGS